MKLHTVQLAKWRKVKERGIELFDVTHKSGNRTFAPNPDFLYAYKRGEITWDEYRERFIAHMRDTLRFDRLSWKLLAEKEEVAIACYCRECVDDVCGVYCHRFILCELLEKLCKKENISFEYMGEIR